MLQRPIPELLAPAGSIDAVRAAIANGADAIYLGAERFNARDEGAQLTMEEVEQACLLAHANGRRIYLTLNILLKPSELQDALEHLGHAVDAGIDAVIVQDIGLVKLIRELYPDLEIHGSTQMTVHDAAAAAIMRDLGVERIVLARENTIEDIRAIRSAVPDIGLESFVHGALCIAYSGQCFMSGMISERSANRGSCAQSCRKDYRLADADNGTILDTGYLISARDLAAHDHLPDIAEAGIGCLKIEGRKKKPEYVATVTRTYRDFLERLRAGTWTQAPKPEEVAPLVQIFSRGFTGGMYGGRAGRHYVTRTQPDNRGEVLGTVVGWNRGELVVDVTSPIEQGDGLGFEAPEGAKGGNMGFAASAVRNVSTRNGMVRQSIAGAQRVPTGWTVVRSSRAALLQRARASFASTGSEKQRRRIPLHARVFGSAGGPLKLVASVNDDTVTVLSEVQLAPASRQPLGDKVLRDQLGRLGDTPFVLATLDSSGLDGGLFLPVSELNHLRQKAAEELLVRRDWAEQGRIAGRTDRIVQAVSGVRATSVAPLPASFALSAEVWRLEDARTAAASGATEISLDLFLRHPTPPVSRVRALADELAGQGIVVRLRTPVIVRPEERRGLDKWLDLGLPIVTGHLGLLRELSSGGRDVVADYATNCFNHHTAAELFTLGARRIVLSVELTAQEMSEVTRPWNGSGFDAFVYGRPEGMTIEHCVLSAAFDREPTTCRDLCVKKHPNVELTDPMGYTFPVATDSACRNRLLHSRPVDGSEYLPVLWRSGIRGYRMVFNAFGDDVAGVTRAYRDMLDALSRGERPDNSPLRSHVGAAFTRGHFARAV
jgi:U32 family peptidase